MEHLDSETLTFLFTDVERSSEAWLKRSLEMTSSIPAVNGVVEAESVKRGGTVFGREGDGRAVHFRIPEAALEAALAIQQELARHPRQTGGLRLRIGVHSGPVFRLHDGQLGGTPLNYVGRMHSAGHGGQIVVSSATKRLLGQTGFQFRWTDLGVYSLRDFSPDRIWQIDVGDNVASFPPLRTRRRFEGPTPVASPLFGRRAELDELDRLLSPGVITTVTGPGGIGKTRLVRALIETRGARFTDGVCFVDLQRVMRPEQVVISVADSLGIDPAIDVSPLRSIGEALVGSDVLVVLDNCEHVRDGAGSAAQALAGAETPTVVATSRTPLSVRGERVYPVGSLRGANDGVPDREHLFAHAAALSRPDFEVDGDSEAIVTSICEQLGGVPLAIELAAARMSAIGPDDLLRLLDDDLEVIDTNDSSARSSIRGALRWSIEALPPEAVEVALLIAHSKPDAGLRELGLLSDLRDADLVEALRQLVENGIVTAERLDEAYRYRMLDPLRKPLTRMRGTHLDQLDLTTRRASIYLTLAEELGTRVFQEDEGRAVRRLTADFGNVRAALLDTISAGDLDRAAQTVSALHMYGFLRMRYEVYSWVDSVLDNPTGISAELRAELTGMAAFRAFNQGRIAEAMNLARGADEPTADDGQITSRVVLMAGHGMAGEFELANDELTKGLQWCDEHDQPVYRTNLHVIASMGLTTQGLFDHAGELAQHALDLAEDVGNPSAVAWSLTALADARRHNAPAEAARILVSALEIARSVSNRWVEGQALLNLTRAHRCEGQLERAVRTCVDSLAHCQQQANHIQTRQGLREAFLLLHQLQHHDLAARIMQPLLARPDTLPPSPDQQSVVDRAIADVLTTTAGKRHIDKRHRSSTAAERTSVAFARTALIELTGSSA